jgi:hypothetical protein
MMEVTDRDLKFLVSGEERNETIKYVHPSLAIEMATELLARREADKKWQPANKPIWIASRYGNIWKVASGYVSALLERDMYMLIADDNPPEPPVQP